MVVIGIDGCDYSGKSRLVSIVKEKAIAAGWEVVVQNFPSNVNHGKKAREALAAGKSASVIAHLIENDFREFSKFIAKTKSEDDKTLIILDRYVISTYSHQGHTIDLSFGEYVIPDVQVLMTLDYETMQERVKERGGVDWDSVETNKYKSPLRWKNLNDRYSEGLRHYSKYFETTLERTGTDDKDDIAEEALRIAGVIK